MSETSLPSPRRRRRRGRRLPPPPKGLHPLEIVAGRFLRYIDTAGLSYEACPPIGPDDFTAQERSRLLRRADTRVQRVRMAESRVARDWYWIAAELVLILPRVSPRDVLRWRQLLEWRVWRAEHALAMLRELQGQVLAVEPESDAWLRRQLATLDPGASA